MGCTGKGLCVSPLFWGVWRRDGSSGSLLETAARAYLSVSFFYLPEMHTNSLVFSSSSSSGSQALCTAPVGETPGVLLSTEALRRFGGLVFATATQNCSCFLQSRFAASGGRSQSNRRLLAGTWPLCLASNAAPNRMLLLACVLQLYRNLLSTMALNALARRPTSHPAVDTHSRPECRF